MARITFSHRIQYIAVRSFTFLLNLLPLRAALALGACMGRTAWLLGVRRRICRINIETAFPGTRRRAVDRIGRESYANTGRFMVEFARQKRMGREYFQRYITVEKNRALEEFLAHEGGVIALGYHFGNWEYNGVCHQFLGKETTFLVGRQHNPLIDSYINSLRSAAGPELLTRDASMRGVIRIARKGGAVCWLSDQYGGRNGIVVDFFGHPASTPRGAAAFSVKLGMPILCGVMIREKGPFQRFSPRAFLIPDPDLPKKEAEADITARYTKVLEEVVREYPEQYWWAHKRWKRTTDIYRRR